MQCEMKKDCISHKRTNTNVKQQPEIRRQYISSNQHKLFIILYLHAMCSTSLGPNFVFT